MKWLSFCFLIIKLFRFIIDIKRIRYLLIIPLLFNLKVFALNVNINSTSNVTPGVLIDNFDDGSDPNLLGGVIYGYNYSPSEKIYVKYVSTGTLGNAGYCINLKYSVPVSGGFCGAEFTLAPDNQTIDLTNYKTLILWVKSIDPYLKARSFQIEMKNTSLDESRRSSCLYLSDYLDGGANETWKEVRIPLKAFANLDSLANVKSIVVTFENNYALAQGVTTYGDIYIDNIGFSTTDLNAVRIDHFGDNWGINALGGNIGPMPSTSNSSISYNTVIYYQKPRSLRWQYDVNISPYWAGVYFIFGGGIDKFTAKPSDYSAYSNFVIYVRGASSTQTPAKIKIELIDNIGSAPHIAIIPDDTNEKVSIPYTTFQRYTIPFSKFKEASSPYTVVDPHSIKQMNLILSDTLAGTNRTGVVYCDYIQFEK